MDLDHAEFGLLEWVLKVKCVIGLQQKNGFEPKIIIPKNMATQETKPGTLVFFFGSVIYIYLYQWSFWYFRYQGLGWFQVIFETAWASNNTWEHTSLCFDSLGVVCLKVETTRLSKSWRNTSLILFFLWLYTTHLLPSPSSPAETLGKSKTRDGDKDMLNSLETWQRNVFCFFPGSKQKMLYKHENHNNL